MASITDDGSRIISSEVHIHSRLPNVRRDRDHLRHLFDVDETSEYALRKGRSRIALQFPDSMLCYSPAVAECLSSVSGRKVFVLGDTSFAPCCCDEVAASHNSADLIVHYGPSCLTATDKSYFVFPKDDVNVTELIHVLDTVKCEERKSVLWLDSSCAHVAKAVWAKWCEGAAPEGALAAGNVLLAFIHPQFAASVHTNYLDFTDVPLEETIEVFGQFICSNGTLEDLDFIYCGPSSSCAVAQFTLLEMGLGEGRVKWHFTDCPSNEQREFLARRMKRRRFVVEKTKQCSTIGIVIQNLSMRGYREMIDLLKKWITNAGKKCYVMLVGKLNVPKLANFSEVDVFVMLSCSGVALLDDKEFQKPVIVPLELALALQDCIEVPPEDRIEYGHPAYFRNDVRALFGHPLASALRSAGARTETDLSLVSGRLYAVGGRAADGPPDEPAAGAVAHSRKLELLPASAAGLKFLAQRNWQGLDPDRDLESMGRAIPTAIIEGARGIASRYEHEKSVGE